MKKRDWQNAFGPAPDAFRERVNETLMRLEEQNMRRRTKFSTTLIAAALIAALLAAFPARKAWFMFPSWIPSVLSGWRTLWLWATS